VPKLLVLLSLSFPLARDDMSHPFPFEFAVLPEWEQAFLRAILIQECSPSTVWPLPPFDGRPLFFLWRNQTCQPNVSICVSATQLQRTDVFKDKSACR